MGDRVNCTVVVLPEHQQQVEALLKSETGGADSEWQDPNDSLSLVYLEYEEINYGNIRSLEKVIAAGIPFDFQWGRGDEYDGGWCHVRFTPEGQLHKVETPADQNAMLCIDTIREWQKDPATFMQNLDKWMVENTQLPWDNQAEYGKCYLARQLITG